MGLHRHPEKEASPIFLLSRPFCNFCHIKLYKRQVTYSTKVNGKNTLLALIALVLNGVIFRYMALKRPALCVFL